jgi:hypothetical protein
MEVNTAQKAIDIAIKFVRDRGYYFAKPKKAILHKKEKVWFVELDIGILEDRFIRLKMSSDTGEITEFTDEQKPTKEDE